MRPLLDIFNSRIINVKNYYYLPSVSRIPRDFVIIIIVVIIQKEDVVITNKPNLVENTIVIDVIESSSSEVQ